MAHSVGVEICTAIEAFWEELRRLPSAQPVFSGSRDVPGAGMSRRELFGSSDDAYGLAKLVRLARWPGCC